MQCLPREVFITVTAAKWVSQLRFLHVSRLCKNKSLPLANRMLAFNLKY